jgi:hypothetical protein
MKTFFDFVLYFTGRCQGRMSSSPSETDDREAVCKRERLSSLLLLIPSKDVCATCSSVFINKTG